MHQKILLSSTSTKGGGYVVCQEVCSLSLSQSAFISVIMIAIEHLVQGDLFLWCLQFHVFFFNKQIRTMLNLTLTGLLHVTEKAGKI